MFDEEAKKKAKQAYKALLESPKADYKQLQAAKSKLTLSECKEVEKEATPPKPAPYQSPRPTPQ